ncbi:hypothetical protein ACS0TY_034247 [Phlomoides rotata]
MEKGSFLIVCAAIFGIFMPFAAAQNVHIVGDGLGWEIPPNTSTSYPNWVSDKIFMVGDILVFNFITNEHDVVQVPRTSYNACTQDNAIGNVITTGPANITLDSAGDHYFICTFGRHCQFGQKLALTVGSSTTTPATPSPASTQPDACAPTTTPAPRASFVPQPDSGSTSVATCFFLIITFACMALIF